MFRCSAIFFTAQQIIKANYLEDKSKWCLFFKRAQRTHSHTHTHAHLPGAHSSRTRTRTHKHTSIHTHTHTRTRTHIHAHAHAHTNIQAYTRTHIHAHIMPILQLFSRCRCFEASVFRYTLFFKIDMSVWLCDGSLSLSTFFFVCFFFNCTPPPPPLLSLQSMHHHLITKLHVLNTKSALTLTPPQTNQTLSH